MSCSSYMDEIRLLQGDSASVTANTKENKQATQHYLSFFVVSVIKVSRFLGNQVLSVITMSAILKIRFCKLSARFTVIFLVILTFISFYH